MKKISRIIVQLYLKFLTKIVLGRHKPFIVAVAGTTNKTFVKETVLDELGRGMEVRGNPKSFNTEIGLPLAVLFLPSGLSSLFKWADVLLTGTCVSVFSKKFPKILVLEMGVDSIGDMEYLLSLIDPKVAIVTNIEQNFPGSKTTIDDIAKEFEILARKMSSSGTLILNGEDERVKKLARATEAKTILFGRDKSFDAVISGVEEDDAGQKFVFSYEGEEEQLETERRGKHNIDAKIIARIVKKELEKRRIK